MHTLDLDILPGLLPGDHLADQLRALAMALLPIGMRVICMGRVGIVAGWARVPGSSELSPFFTHTEPFQNGPGSVDVSTGCVTRSNTHLPWLRAQIIVDAATIPHLCKVIAESFGWMPSLGESFGIRREGGRWSILSTHGARWDLDFTPRAFPATPEGAVIAALIARIDDLASAYTDREPERIG